jgi:tetratricopeptide (TPR) repeat protein
MKVRSVKLAFVSTVFLAALGAISSSAFASTSSSNPIATEAYSALASGDSARAISLYSQAIESRNMAPELLANSLLNRALAYQQSKQHDLAVNDYSAALALDAMSADLRSTALYNRGLSQQKLGKLPLAIEDYTGSLMLKPDFPHAFLSRGNALRESGQFLFALSDFDRAIKYKHPDPARVYFSEAQTYELLKRPIDQKRMLQASLAANASFAPALEKMSELGELANSNVQTAQSADPILTGSLPASGGNTLVHKPDLPLGVEPPAELQTASVQTETPVFNIAHKLYTDRVTPTEEAAAAVEETVAKPVIVAQVPAIPAPLKMKLAAPVKQQAQATVVGKEEDTETVGSVGAAPAKGWSVQVASADSENGAWTTWKNMQKRYKVLSGQSPSVIKADLGTKGIFYRVRFAGFDDQSSAQTACMKFKAKGVSCFVSKAST